MKGKGGSIVILVILGVFVVIALIFFSAYKIQNKNVAYEYNQTMRDAISKGNKAYASQYLNNVKNSGVFVNYKGIQKTLYEYNVEKNMTDCQIFKLFDNGYKDFRQSEYITDTYSNSILTGEGFDTANDPETIQMLIDIAAHGMIDSDLVKQEYFAPDNNIISVNAFSAHFPEGTKVDQNGYLLQDEVYTVYSSNLNIFGIPCNDGKYILWFIKAKNATNNIEVMNKFDVNELRLDNALLKEKKVAIAPISWFNYGFVGDLFVDFDNADLYKNMLTFNAFDLATDQYELERTNNEYDDIIDKYSFLLIITDAETGQIEGIGTDY